MSASIWCPACGRSYQSEKPFGRCPNPWHLLPPKAGHGKPKQRRRRRQIQIKLTPSFAKWLREYTQGKVGGSLVGTGIYYTRRGRTLYLKNLGDLAG